ncbi:hypothetical protein PENTCL1PPCAC_26708 [Pristionchus entomophagus]|uniref:Peptidase n=1 Tax=Pristionchus entomophagus TaxID=358040 RepID=A0AAV5UC71_9BILA|nr:hypothetical protein PENTCL1PPCAC_26708 [Pristionchus entomophagus]
MQPLVLLSFVGLALAGLPYQGLFHGRPRHGFVDHGARLSHQRAGKVVSSNAEDYPGVDTKWFTQKVTHFDDSNKDTYQQRYRYNNNFRKGNDIVFLLIEGESEASLRWAGYPKYQWLQMAADHGADAFQLEHRCFGQSRPYDDLSNTTLEYCLMEEALEDVASFIQGINVEMKYKNPKWVTFGGSYPGILSATFRSIHPELTVGAVASSAPLTFTFDMWEYAWSMEETFKTIPGCAEAIQNSFTHAQQMILDEDQRDKLNTKLKLNPPFTKTTNYIEFDNFFENLFAVFQDVVQYTMDGRNEATKGPEGKEIYSLCKLMTTNDDPIDKLWNVIVWSNDQDGEAITEFPNSYDDFITYLRNETFDDEADGLPQASNRGWLWLQCSQLGVQQSTDQGKNIFGQIIPINYFIRLCKDGFGEDFMSAQNQYDRTAALRKKYGTGNYKATNVVLPNGSFDPWHKLGFYTPDEENGVVPVPIDGTAHCADMYEEYDGEPKDLERARQIVRDNVAKWLK